jgi:uncharacterized protein (DUF433 family)
MSYKLETDVLRMDSCGVWRIGATRVTLDSIIDCYERGDSPADILEAFPTLTAEEVYAAVAYYLNHRGGVERYIRQQEAASDALRMKVDSDPRNIEARKRIEQRARERGIR